MAEERIEQSVTVRAPAERVFAALTRAGELAGWFPTRAESDPRAGGRFRYEWEFASQPERDHLQEGEYRVFQAPSRVSYPWKAGGHPTSVEFEVSGSDGASTVSLVHSGWSEATAEAREHHAAGWGFFLENLRSVLEEGVDRRGEALGMRTRG